jgi:hypothetical protein
LLVDLSPTDPDYSTLLIIEAKRIAPGENDGKIEEIIGDYRRIRLLPELDASQMPLFFGIAHPVEWFYGGLLVVLPESCDKYGDSAVPLFSTWWEDLANRPHGFCDEAIARLEHILRTAQVRRAVRVSPWDGLRRMAVTYALFDFGPGPGSLPTAEHEAAHAVVAKRLDVPVRFMGLAPEGDLRGGIVCDWESLRGALSNRDTCIRGFAVAYAGAQYDVLISEDETTIVEVLNQLPTDSQAVEDVRNKFRDWEQSPSTADSAGESFKGCRLAEQIVREELERIERLGEHLLEARTMDEQALRNWFAEDEKART